VYEANKEKSVIKDDERKNMDERDVYG